MKLDVYMDRNGEYRWNLKARNGQILADSAEGYRTKHSLMRALRRLKRFVETDAPRAVESAIDEARSIRNMLS